MRTALALLSLLALSAAQDCYVGRGSAYRGDVNVTSNGLECQPWSVQAPHGHAFTPTNYPDAGLDGNYCRNPDSDVRPWCYTMDPNVRYGYCDAPQCDCMFNTGEFYKGSKATSISGLTCQRWDSQSPHQHDRTPQNYPENDLRENYCRNPDGEPRTWCYTTDPSVRWEHCDVPKCDNADLGSCGEQAIQPTFSRIVGGTVAAPGSWPWQVSLGYGSNGQHVCGATLIAPDWVLSAAHCFAQLSTNPGSFVVKVGKHNKASTDSTEQSMQVAQIIVHPRYQQEGQNTNDIALLKLVGRVQLNDYVMQACITETEAPEGAMCVATGFGNTEGTGGDNYLKQVQLPLLSNTQCRSWLGSVIQSSMVCAGYESGGSDTCQGDSGGPLTCPRLGKWFVSGVTSFGQGCADPRKPGVYTRVGYYIDWILKYTANN
uniref:Plasminogen n=1 Tax=Branchiostoma floridae TaxID=7739 RepID=C3Z5A6_BRAFL|eukprot:XP_002596007.1 hypothetical protein BRAFLDRAFT_123738 [Branchiostoma floridae]